MNFLSAIFSRSAGIKPVAGIEVRNGDKFLYILLAANINGLAWIHEFLSEHLIEKKPFPETIDHTDVFIIYSLYGKPLEQLLPNERIGILPWEVNKLISVNWKNHKDKFVVLQLVTFQNKTYFNLHRLLRAIDKNCLLSKLSVESQASEKETFVSPSELLKSFEHS